MNPSEKAVLAGGCFWGMQDLVRKLPGVLRTRVGYSGGDVPNATYRNHGTHAEALEVEFDPTQTSFRDLRSSSSRSTIRAPRGARAMTAAVPTGRPFSTPRTSSWPRRSRPLPM